MRIRLIGLLLLATLPFGRPAMSDPQVVCTVQGCSEISIPKPRYGDAAAFSVQQVWEVVDEILSVSGLLPNFQVVETDEVGNAAAIIIDGERYLAFNAGWLNSYRSNPNARWQLYGVMAHEIGHHLQGHTLTGTGSRPPTELEADEYAGFTLAAQGASLTEAQSLWATLSETGSATHPPRHQRLAAVERGWLKRRRQMGGGTATPAAQTPQAPPPPEWTTRHCGRTQAAGGAARLCFSSQLSAQGANTYGPGNASDRNDNTAWVEGASGHGIGEGFSIAFDAPRRINRVNIRNGYAKSDRTYTRNSRLKRLRVTASTGQQFTLGMQDSRDWQGTGKVSEFGPVHWIAFEILEVFPGSHYQDTAINEIGFD